LPRKGWIFELKKRASAQARIGVPKEERCNLLVKERVETTGDMKLLEQFVGE